MTLDELKKLVGKNIYLIPTGNNTRRGVRNSPIKAVILERVAKVNLSFTRIDGRCQRTHRFQETRGNVEMRDKDGNSGYKIFASQEDADNYLKTLALRSQVHRALRMFDLSSLTHKQLLSLIETLGLKVDNED